ncbi:MAG: aspartate aminotransferase family protein [Candidatus Zipacnadales bacterium]
MPRIKTRLPGPKARAWIKKSKAFEPNSMSDQVPLVWAQAHGCEIEDVDGNVFLDFSSGVLVTNIGHCHPDYVAAVQEQAERLYNCYDFPTPERVALAEKLVAMTPPHLDKCFLLTTGSEATEAAVKMARRAHEGYEILTFHGAFHGRTFGAMSFGGSAGVKKGFGPLLPGVIHAPFCYCYRCVFGKEYPSCGLWCIDHLDWVISKESAGALCAVITEPYQGGAGSIIPPPGYMERLFAWAKDRGLYFILDEVQSSFGRTGRMFAMEHYGIKPDLVCLAKGLGSGIPCAAVLGRHEIMDVLQPGELSSTNGGNPMSSRAALAAIEIIERERLPERAAELGEQMGKRFRALQRKVKQIGDVRGQGLVYGIEMVEDRKTKAPAPALTKRIVHEAYLRGLCLIAPIGMYGNVIRIAPPLVITKEQMEEGMDLLEQAMLAAIAG